MLSFASAFVKLLVNIYAYFGQPNTHYMPSGKAPVTGGDFSVSM